MAWQSTAIRQTIEAQLAHKIPAALSPRIRSEAVLLPCRNCDLAPLIQDGLAVGSISEVFGDASSGRTSMALSLVSDVTASGGFAGWIDTTDSLVPESAALAGVLLDRLLWVRCGKDSKATQSIALASTQVKTAAKPMDRPVGNGGCGSPHPRSEGHGMPQAIQELLQSQPRSAAGHARRERKRIGTPGVANRPLSEASPHREEQIPTDRLPPRRGSSVINSAGVVSAGRGPIETAANPRRRAPGTEDTWAALDQALRATDLLLQAGGFALLVLDMGDVPIDRVRRIPMARWFRYRTACERTQTSLLVLSQGTCVGTAADLIMRAGASRIDALNDRVWNAAAYSLHVEKSRRPVAVKNVVSIRKPVQRTANASWRVQTQWATTA
jgi:recombination protein RecA